MAGRDGLSVFGAIEQRVVCSLPGTETALPLEAVAESTPDPDADGAQRVESP
jgi:hypothetical protein